MGELFEFKCPGCGYRAEVSGGEDCGDIVITETMVCKKCLRVVDVEVGFAARASVPAFLPAAVWPMNSWRLVKGSP
jgi:hypothetical protein